MHVLKHWKLRDACIVHSYNFLSNKCPLQSTLRPAFQCSFLIVRYHVLPNSIKARPPNVYKVIFSSWAFPSPNLVDLFVTYFFLSSHNLLDSPSLPFPCNTNTEESILLLILDQTMIAVETAVYLNNESRSKWKIERNSI